MREGEYQRKDGRYRFRYIDEDGKEKNVYSWRLDKNINVIVDAIMVYIQGAIVSF